MRDKTPRTSTPQPSTEQREFVVRDLRGATFQTVTMSEARLEDVDLGRATLVDVNLAGSRMSDVDLSESELSDVNLAGTVIRDAHVAGLTINGVDVGRLIAEAGRESGASMARPILHVDLPTDDRRATARFYAGLLGWEVGDTDASAVYTPFRSGNLTGGFPNVLGGLRSVTGAMRVGEAILYVPSDDLEADLTRAETLGGTVLLPRTQVGEGMWVALIADPNGARLALATDKSPA